MVIIVSTESNEIGYKYPLKTAIEFAVYRSNIDGAINDSYLFVGLKLSKKRTYTSELNTYTCSNLKTKAFTR